jgi:hypothetical protein
MTESTTPHGRFLIGPDLYPHWARTTRLIASIVVPLVAAASLIAGMMADKGALEIVASTLWTTVVAFVSVAFWCTFGFAVAERAGQRSSTWSWTPDDLGQVPAPSRPGLGETIGSVVIASGSAALLVLQRGWGRSPLIHPDAWDGRAQVVVGGLVAGAVVAVLAHLRGWTTVITLANVAINLVLASIVLWLATTDVLINPAFFDALDATERSDLAELSGWVTAIIVIIVAVIDSIESINGWRRHRRRPSDGAVG